MLNKENYVPWSSHLLRYAKSRPNGKLIHNSIINGPYVRWMIPELGDTNREVPVNETFHIQTDDELTEKELKQIEADDQAIQTILFGLPKDIYAAVDSYKTAQEIWLKVQQMMKGSDIGIQEKKAKLFNEWERFTSNEGESIESYYHCFLKLMNDLKQNKHFPNEVDELKVERLVKIQDSLALMTNSNNLYAFPAPHQDQPSFNQNYMQHLMPNPKDITDPTTIMNMALALMAKAFKLNYSTPTNNNQRISSNPRNRESEWVQRCTECRESGCSESKTRTEGIAAGHNGNQIRCYNCRGVGYFARNCTVRPRRRDAAYLQTQLLIAQKKKAEIQLQAEEFDLMAAAADLDEIKEVNAKCILMANLQQASTSGTQTDKAPVYDSDGSAEVHDYKNFYDNEIFNMFTQEEQYTELLEPISEPHQVPQNDNDIIYEVTSVEQSEETVEQHPVNFEETRALYDSLYQNLAIEVEKVNSVNRKLKETNANLTTELARFKNQENCFEIKTLQLTQESHEKMKQLNKEIKPANYTKINHLSGVFVSQTAKSREELYFSNDSKSVNVLTSILIPNEEFSDDTTPSVTRKFLNEVKSTIVTLQRVVKHRMTLETHNWSSSAHQGLHKIVKDEIFPIINQVDARVQNFEIQFLKEAAKFVRDFKSLAKEANESLVKHKALELGIERLLRAVVSQDIMSVVLKTYVVDTSNLQTELERTKERFENYIIKKENEYAKLWNDWYKKCDECKFDKISYDKAYKDMQQKIERLQAQLRDITGKSKDTSCVTDTLNPLSQKLKNENVELEFQVLNYARENAHLKTTYKNLFDSIFVSCTQTKTIIASLQHELQNTIYENAKLRAQLFKKVTVQKDNTRGTSKNTKFIKQSILGKPPMLGEIHALSKPFTSNSTPTPQESKVVKNDKVIAPGMFRINPFKTSREAKHVPNNVRASSRTKPITISQPSVITKKDVNSDSNGLSSIGIENTKTRRPQPRSNIKNDRVPSASKSSQIVCAMFKQCLISGNHDVCLRNYVNCKTSRGKKQKANVSTKEKQKKHQPKVKKPKKVGFIERIATPKPSKPGFLLRWSPTGRLFDQKGKIVDSSESKSQSDCSNGDTACTSNTLEPKIKRFPNFTSLLGRVYFVEGLGHSLFSVGQFSSASTICLIARASSTKSWLWHQHLSHLNFDTINDLAKNDLVSGLPKFKYHKEHLCPSCEQGKSKRASHPPKPVLISRQRLHLLHMDLCGPVRIVSINGKRYVLVIVDDYSRYTWVNFLRSKDETLEVIKTFLKRITVLLQSPVIIIRTDNVERRNRTLVEATRTMLIFSHAPFFLWAEAIATVCFTQNRSIIHHRFNKTPYDLINCKKPDISFLHVFGALCYPKNDREDIGKLGAKGELDLLFKAMYDDYIGGQSSATAKTVLAAQAQQDVDELNLQQHVQQQGNQAHLQSTTVAENVSNAMFDANTFVNPFANPSTSVVESLSSQNVDPSNMHMNQLRSDGDMCMYALTVSTMESKNVREAMTDPAWIDSMQKEVLRFQRLDVWVLVPAPDNISPFTLKWLFKNKHDKEQTVIRNKSRLVVGGYRQEEGIDFEESFAPVYPAIF
nr:retrovirus-related Pol polyprotein from transposon TNT 1-94 [Tanacetum cinerariifolium]